ncbi:adenylate/guanylate cyclase domain-containing protein [uncultured Draconibacterium sp.]|uniref:adenylate/guanylate cyclase domain-containing protein n=1 Tax=uncultured Draconibacterium sp. TaxID=1573823 RepID=UPI002AA670EE|nr:adenylate/guanylate cyclase domain-containing protein [uncultured Draconibacterium sp.]
MEEVKTIEAKHIFIDIVNYTHNRSVEAQTDLIKYLNDFVTKSMEEEKIPPEQKIFIPTGDGMCITLLNISIPFDIHIRIALNILKRINEHNNSIEDDMRKFDIRIGINENTDNLIIDINNNKNISGAGINYASRIEGQGDSGQILVGNAVFEKLVQREKYMKSFNSYSTTVKHGLPLKVHQYKNESLKYLNNETPSKFKPAPQKIFRLSEIQAYYLASCIKNEDFIIKNLDGAQSNYSMRVLLIQLAEDLYEKTKVTKTNPNLRIKVKRELQEHFIYIQSVDFWLVCDLDKLNKEKHLSVMGSMFTEEYLIVNDRGKKQLKNDFPEICKQFEIE